jgi:hypothetical protein
MRSLSLLFVAVLALLAVTQAIPGCSFGNLDFSSIGNTDLYFYGSWTYVLRLCGSVSDSICLADTTTINSMLCQRRNNTVDNAWNLMTWNQNNGVWGADGTAVTYQLATGETCNAAITTPRSTTIRLQCNLAATTPYISSVTEPSTCQYQVILQTSLACTTNVACGFLGIDISPIFPNGNDLSYSTTTGTPYTWFLNMCGAVRDSGCRNDSTTANSMICQRRVDGADAYGIATYNQSAVTWSLVRSGANAGLSAISRTGEYCGAISANRVSHIKLVCDRSLASTGSYIAGITETSTCNYEVTVYTPHTCSFLPASTGTSNGVTSSWWPDTSSSCVFTPTNNPRRVLDFSSLKNSNDLVYEGFVGGNYYNVYFHLCGVVRDPQCLNDSTTYNSMICQASITNSRDNWALGTFSPNSMIWAELPYGAQYYQQTGEFCGAIQRSIVVEFRCKSSATRPVIVSAGEPSTCSYVMLIETNLVCNGTNEPVPTSNEEPLYRNCVYQLGTKQYDFKTINPANNEDLSIFVNTSASSQYNVYLKMCSIVKNIRCRSDTTSQKAMVCQQQLGLGDSYSIADYVENNMIWGQVPGEQKIRLKMINGEDCGSNKKRTLSIDFICDTRYSQPTILSFVEPLTCEYKMVVAANNILCKFDPSNPDGEGSSSSDNMNGGMVALIVIVIILGLILIIAACAAWRYYDRPTSYQKDSFEKNVEMQQSGEAQSYEHEASQSTV